MVNILTSEFSGYFVHILNVTYFIAITILDIIHRSVFYLKHNVSETGFCLRLQAPYSDGHYLRKRKLSLSMGPICVGSTPPHMS
jgi:hypothetical protein